MNPTPSFFPKIFLYSFSYLAMTLLLCIPLQAQEDQFEQLLDQGKSEFKAGEEMGRNGTGDIDSIVEHYRSSAALLEQAVALNPGSQEAHYFLAYAYDRIESAISPGDSLPSTTLEQTRKVSAQLEKVLEIAPEYNGEIAILQPRSKLTSTWGSLAFSYALRGQFDSARWAFQEGRRVGGFPEDWMDSCRSTLRSCGENAILLVNSDDDTFPLWYLQAVEGLRKDITVVNLSLSNLAWYDKNLKNSYRFGSNNLPLRYTDQQLDTLQYSDISKPKSFRITVPKNVLKQYGVTDKRTLQRGALTLSVPGHVYDGDQHYMAVQDLVLLNMLEANQWRRPIYYAPTVDPVEIFSVGLTRFVEQEGTLIRITPREE